MQTWSATHAQYACEAWCAALKEKYPDIAALGDALLASPPEDLHGYLYPGGLPKEEWDPRAAASWYAILRHGAEHGDTLEYW